MGNRFGHFVVKNCTSDKTRNEEFPTLCIECHAPDHCSFPDLDALFEHWRVLCLSQILKMLKTYRIGVKDVNSAISVSNDRNPELVKWNYRAQLSLAYFGGYEELVMKLN